MDENCGNCRFARHDWLKHTDEGAELFCHRHAPTRTVIGGTFLISPMSAFRDENDEIDRGAYCEIDEPDHAQWVVTANHADVDLSGLWPLVCRHEWCGEWQAGPTPPYTFKRDLDD